MIKKHAIRFAVGALGGLMAVGIVFAAVPHNYNKDAGILEEAGQTDDDGKKQIALSNCTVTISQDSYESDGTEKKPEVTVKRGDEVIPPSEYTAVYSDNVNAGTATVTVTANDDSSAVRGSITKTFTNSFEWSISDDGKLIVTGSCSGKLYTEEGHDVVYPWHEYKYQIKSVYIDVTGLTDMRYMFAYCKNLSSVDVSDLDTSKVTDMGSMFTNCASLRSVDVSGFDTSKVTNMTSMFSCNIMYYSSSLSSVDVSGFDTSNVTSMGYMFAGCSNLSSVDVSSFDVSYRSAYMSGMFKDCYNLTEIIIDSDMSGWWELCEEIGGNLFDGCGAVDVTFK